MSRREHGSEREAFERWLAWATGVPSFSKDKDGVYIGRDIQLMWMGWQTRALKKWYGEAPPATLAGPGGMAHRSAEPARAPGDHETQGKE